MLSTAEIAAKYPADFLHPFEVWRGHLADWRAQNILARDRHWILERRGGPRPAFCYQEVYILKVVWKNIDASPFCYTVYTHHKDTILQTLQSQQILHAVVIPATAR